MSENQTDNNCPSIGVTLLFAGLLVLVAFCGGLMFAKINSSTPTETYSAKEQPVSYNNTVTIRAVKYTATIHEKTDEGFFVFTIKLDPPISEGHMEQYKLVWRIGRTNPMIKGTVKDSLDKYNIPYTYRKDL